MRGERISWNVGRAEDEILKCLRNRRAKPRVECPGRRKSEPGHFGESSDFYN